MPIVRISHRGETTDKTTIHSNKCRLTIEMINFIVSAQKRKRHRASVCQSLCRLVSQTRYPSKEKSKKRLTMVWDLIRCRGLRSLLSWAKNKSLRKCRSTIKIYRLVKLISRVWVREVLWDIKATAIWTIKVKAGKMMTTWVKSALKQIPSSLAQSPATPLVKSNQVRISAGAPLPCLFPLSLRSNSWPQ